MTNEEKEDLIISRPQALSPARKGTEMTMTVAGWLIWALLCRPLILVFLWFLGVKIFYEHMIRLQGISSLADFAFINSAIAVFIFYVLIRGWNIYNRWMFKGKKRRVGNPSVSFQDLERFFKLPPQTMNKIQEWKDITINFPGGDRLLLKETTEKSGHSVERLGKYYLKRQSRHKYKLFGGSRVVAAH